MTISFTDRVLSDGNTAFTAVLLTQEQVDEESPVNENTCEQVKVEAEMEALLVA